MIHIITGTRPNIVKAAPLCRALDAEGLSFELIHTGQHFDHNMAGAFFKDLGLPPLLENLDTLSGWPGVMGRKTVLCQISHAVEFLEVVFENRRPDIVVVFGDVNSSLAAALVANKTCIPLAHIEAGERSFDRSMPEEINRVLIDAMADLLFCSSLESFDRLNGWHPDSLPGQGQQAYHVGNIMVDQLIRSTEKIKEKLSATRRHFEKYAVLTMHRQAAVDDRGSLMSSLQAAGRAAVCLPVIFPIHPRTKKRVKEFGLEPLLAPFEVIDPLGYIEFVGIVRDAALVMTDSGGLQVETSVLDVPCLTMRNRTEWLDTTTFGTNVLVGFDGGMILEHVETILAGKWKHRKTNQDWDGRAGERIAKILKKEINHVRQAV